MSRRDFLKTVGAGILALLLSAAVDAGGKPEQHLTEAMFWRRVE